MESDYKRYAFQMKSLTMPVAILMLVAVMSNYQAQAQDAEQANLDLHLDAEYFPPSDPLVREKLQQWRDLKFGMIIHWGLYAVPGIVESWSICSEDESWIPRDSSIRYDDYKRWYWSLSEQFNPVQFDPEQWARTARDAGMKYVVFTTKHHDGFAMFDSKYSDFTIAKGPFAQNSKADVTKYVFEAFRNQGMMIGAYFSKPDWHSQDYWWDRYATADRHVNYKIENHPQRWNDFKQFVYNQIDEITSNYGQIDILWLDGGWVRVPREDVDMSNIATMARRNQPGLLIVDRTVQGPYENYRTPEKMIPEKQLSYPWETCVPLSKDWGFVPNATFKTPQQIVAMLVEVVAKGGSLLLGVGPTPDGVIEDAVVKTLNRIGKWLKVNGKAIYATRSISFYHDGDVWFTGSKDGNNVYAFVMPSALKARDNTISWKHNLPRKGSKVTLLSNKKNVKYKIKDDVLTLSLPSDADFMPQVLEFVIEQ